MKCIVCHQGNLEITNSRKHPSELRVWRRRKCSQCETLFTTKELPDYDRAFYIARGKRKKDKFPFEKTMLLAQLFAAGGHLKNQQDLLWLAETIAAQAFTEAAKRDFLLTGKEYQHIIANCLEAYDTLLAANFAARNPAYSQ